MPNQPKPKHWSSPAPIDCQLCDIKLKDKFIDGKTKWGPWAIMCEWCWRQMGVGLGTGLGQLYDLTTLQKLGG